MKKFIELIKGYIEKRRDESELMLRVFSKNYGSMSVYDDLLDTYEKVKEKFPKDEKGHIIGINRAFIGDSLGCIIGSLCGTTPLTTYVESVVGISVGGKTGLTTIF